MPDQHAQWPWVPDSVRVEDGRAGAVVSYRTRRGTRKGVARVIRPGRDGAFVVVQMPNGWCRSVRLERVVSFR